MRIPSNIAYLIFVSELFFIGLAWYYVRLQGIIIFEGFSNLGLETLPILNSRGFIATCSLSDINYLCPLGYGVYLEIFVLITLIGIPLMALMQKLSVKRTAPGQQYAQPVTRRNSSIIERKPPFYIPVFKILFAIAIILIQFLIGPEVKEGRDFFGNIIALFGSYWFVINVSCLIIAIGLFWQNKAPTSAT